MHEMTHALRTALVALPLLLALDSASGARTVEPTEHAVELTLAELDLPANVSGALGVRACPRCAPHLHRLGEETVLRSNGRVVALAELLRLADEIRRKPQGAETAVAVVFFDVATGRVTRLEVRE
jgi:hypothetical protein